MPASLLFNDREILKRVADRDERAFDQIYEVYSKKIYFFALKTLQSAQLAEEVMQEIMLKIWRLGPDLAKIENLDAYLRTSSRNLSLNMLRRQELEGRADRKLAQTWKDGHNDTEEQVILNDTRKILQDAIKLLPPQQREVYTLCHQQGMKYEEVAKKLNLAPSTVATHMKLALRFLRAYLQKHADIAAILIIFKFCDFF